MPFARDEFTAERITLYVNVDLGQIRGYSLGEKAERLLVLLALYKLRALLDGSLRLRTACDLEVVPGKAGSSLRAQRPGDFELPSLQELTPAVQEAIRVCKDRMVVTDVHFNDELKKGKEEKEDDASSGANVEEAEEP